MPPAALDALPSDLEETVSLPFALKRSRLPEEIDSDSDDEGPPTKVAREVENWWRPGFFMNTWTSLLTKRNMVTIMVHLMSGTTDPGRVKVAVTDDGMQLVIKTRVPEIMMEEHLPTLHLDELLENRDHDFHYRLGALDEAVDAAKKIWGGPAEEYYWIARIPLKFACEKVFEMRNKGDKKGARMLYITLKEKGNEDEITALLWPILDDPMAK